MLMRLIPGSGLFRWIARIVLWFVLGSVALTAIYRFVPVPITLTMIADAHGFDKNWTPLSRIDRSMVDAVIAGEDARFCQHRGFDGAGIEYALKRNAQGGRLRGGSTISQQTAKNVFLWQGSGFTRYLRKGLESWFTLLIETIWGKRRIMEVYLNTVEMGPGTYGVEAAARRDFHVSAHDLSPAQAARLAAILPSPLKWSAERPGPYVERRTGRIGARSSTVSHDGLADCVLG